MIVQGTFVFHCVPENTFQMFRDTIADKFKPDEIDEKIRLANDWHVAQRKRTVRMIKVSHTPVSP